MSHDLLGHEHDILPQDAMKAVVALSRAGRILPDTYPARKIRYGEAAAKAFAWLQTTAKPLGAYGFQFLQRGLPGDTPIPADEWPTRQVVQLLWAGFERWLSTGAEADKDYCVARARELRSRQIPADRPEAGYHGHFVEFPSLPHSESAWRHGIARLDFGTDLGISSPTT
ncbi:MAG: hypothetical protein R2751_15955 [Bacteroidales bacterium]